ncbi:hypothetical protein [Bacteroides heparinolyticus]|uniref:hypothetical protein n=1 Tax=Prevotella heparinolytica TaxID=28113 RepID=UPI0035A11BF1
MNSKTVAILAYVTLIGWLIAFFAGKEQRDDFNRYHLKQGFGLFVISFIYSIIINILGLFLPAGVTMILSLLSLVFLVLMIVGAINASNEVKKPLPIIGKMFEDKFGFI